MRRTQLIKMAAVDRRSGRDRRAVPRYDVSIHVEWEGLIGRREGTITDISTRSCYVFCSGEVEDGETVVISIPLKGGIRAEFRGEVVNHFYDIGFAARFVDMTAAERDFLEKFVEALRG